MTNPTTSLCSTDSLAIPKFNPASLRASHKLFFAHFHIPAFNFSFLGFYNDMTMFSSEFIFRTSRITTNSDYGLHPSRSPGVALPNADKDGWPISSFRLARLTKLPTSSNAVKTSMSESLAFAAVAFAGPPPLPI
ncbi:hypothetical protein EVAR_27286_1 [Eumeta japonica]|uniref:Uncharacterized protein n=1 Tax=Eumeta variegata TaxID=151549 RepID=A0A4C1UC51_EUMVA|nr:hypothetical protein EVAR_27286_1 [Eumeta japonica]